MTKRKYPTLVLPEIEKPNPTVTDPIVPESGGEWD